LFYFCNISNLSQAALLLSKIPSEIVGEPLVANRFYDAVNVLLSLQVIDDFIILGVDVS
jgi:cycloartenol synthase